MGTDVDESGWPLSNLPHVFSNSVSCRRYAVGLDTEKVVEG